MRVLQEFAAVLEHGKAIVLAEEDDPIRRPEVFPERVGGKLGLQAPLPGQPA